MPRRPRVKAATDPQPQLSDRVSPAAFAQHAQRRPVARSARALRLPIEQLRPVVRLAHKAAGMLNIPPRVIPDFELVLITRGKSTCVAGETSMLLRPGELLLIPPFIQHRFEQSPPGTEHIGVHFDLSPSTPGVRLGARSRAYRVELSHGWSVSACRVWSAGREIAENLHRIVEVFRRRTPAGDLECSSLLGAVIARLMGRQPSEAEAANHDWRLRVLLSHIEANLEHPLEAEELAEVAGLSESRLRAVFKRQMGVSPKQYIRQRRVALARRLLAEPALSLKEIARKTGFADEFHFSKSFRAIDGIPPSSYRQQALASRF